ncbi:trans-sialidase, partial [Trypanosoma conorhini]
MMPLLEVGVNGLRRCLGGSNGESGSLVFRYGPRAVVKGNKILLLLMSYTEPTGTPKPNSQGSWEAALHEGTVADSSGSKSITWTTSTTPSSPALNSTFTTEMGKKKWRSFVDNAGRGVVHKSKVFFPLVAVSSESGVRVCTVISLTERNGETAGGGTWSFSSGVPMAEGCVAATLLEWKEKLLMIAVTELRRYRLYGSADAGATWTEMTGTHAHLLGDFLNGVEPGEGDDFITATIDGTEVVLFARRWHSYDNATGATRSVLQLWVTDGRRLHPVGPISTEPPQSHDFSALLHTGDNGLFAMYERRDNTSSGLLLAP